MMTLHDLPDDELHDLGFADPAAAKAAVRRARADCAIREVCRARVHRLVAEEMQGLDEAAIDALFNELSVWFRREGRAHRQTAKMSGTVRAVLALPARSDAASPDQEYRSTYQPRPERRFQATPTQPDNATRPVPWRQDDPAAPETASRLQLFAALKRLRIRSEGSRAADGTREAAPRPSAEGIRGYRPHPQLPEAETTPRLGAGHPEHSDQSSCPGPFDNRFRFKRLDLNQIGALAHRICDAAEKTKLDDDAGGVA